MQEPERSPPDQSHAGWIAWVVIAVAAFWRIAGALGDLWLDEIMSLTLAGRMTAATDVWSLHHDNNHHLNTLWLYIIGDGAPSLLYRLPALATGIGSVWLAGVIGRRRDRATGMFAQILIGTSYVLVLLSSEARGYAPMVFCALAAFALLEHLLVRDDPRAVAAYAAVATLGVLSHPVFANVLVSAAAWSAFVFWRSRRQGVGSRTLTWFVCHVPPSAVLIALYVVDLRVMEVGGGTTNPSLIDAYGVSLACALAAIRGPGALLVVWVLAVGTLVAGLRALTDSRDSAWIFFSGAIVVAPVLFTVAFGTHVVYVRYFVGGITFLLILASIVLGTLWRSGRAGRTACVGLTLAYAVINGSASLDLVGHGRGSYRAALRGIAAEAGGATTVGGDHDLRIGLVAEHYLSRAATGSMTRFVREGEWPDEGPDWLIMHKESTERPVPPADRLADARGRHYSLVAQYPSANLSGLHWFVYRRVQSP